MAKKNNVKLFCNWNRFNPFFQVFFLNEIEMEVKEVKTGKFQSLFSGLLFKWEQNRGYLEKIVREFQSLFSGLLFKFGVFQINPTGSTRFNPFFQVFFLNKAEKPKISKEAEKCFNPFFQVFFLNTAPGNIVSQNTLQLLFRIPKPL